MNATRCIETSCTFWVNPTTNVGEIKGGSEADRERAEALVAERLKVSPNCAFVLMGVFAQMEIPNALRRRLEP
jgi:hypothetical protein